MSLLLAFVGGGGATDTTAPSVSASFTWVASASDPLVGVLAPSVSAGFVWSANAAAPTYDTNAPSVAASFAWSASAADPTTGSGATTTDSVSASFAWSASVADPVFDVLAPAVAGSFVWSAAAGDPFEAGAGDVTAPEVAASTQWLAVCIDAVPTTAGRNEADDWNLAGYDVRARRVRAEIDWRAVARPPVIGRPSLPVRAPAVAVPPILLRAAAHDPRGLILVRSHGTVPRQHLVSTTRRPGLIRSTGASLMRS